MRKRVMMVLAVIPLLMTLGGQSANAQTQWRYLKSSISNYCLDARGGNFRAQTYLHPCHRNNGNTHWRFTLHEAAPSKYFAIQTAAQGRCLDAAGGRHGAVTYMRWCNGGNPNHKWSLHLIKNLGTFRNPDWVFQIRSRVPPHHCLDANGGWGAVTYMAPCSRSNRNVLWRLQNR